MPPVKRVGYAVVGLGSISQVAVLPAFAHSEGAELIALVSGDKRKAEKLRQEFKGRQAYSYTEYAECLKNPKVEAVYIATPPGEHEKYSVAAARQASMCCARSRSLRPCSRAGRWSRRAAGTKCNS
jgi:predicted dehydrogenase